MERKEREIIEIKPITQLNNKIKVAAYARVSTNSVDQMSSFTSQVRYYTDLIENNPEWEMADIYADEGITGVSIEKRTDFKRMLDDCKKGKIDRIITKSTSRFARNIIDALNVVRELKSLGITVYFEKENIDTENLSSENLLTLYSLFAQEESKSISQNCKKGIRMSMAEGTYVIPKAPYGYRLENKNLVVNKSESEVVRRIFSDYIGGKGAYIIACELNDDKIPFRSGNINWTRQCVTNILKNEKYIGDMLLQKNYSDDTMPYRVHKNCGELPKYYVKHSHEPIIEKIQFEIAGIIMKERAANINTKTNIFPLSKRIICKECGTTYRRKVIRDKVYWVCKRHDENKDFCSSQCINEELIYSAFIRMYNKLSDNYNEILNPMIYQLEKLKDISERNNPQIYNINKKIADLLEQNRVITELQSKGILDSAVFISQTDEINRKVSDLKNKKSQVISEDDDEILEDTYIIVSILKENSEILDEFNDGLFEQLVEKIYANNNETIEFKLINGLILTERL